MFYKMPALLINILYCNIIIKEIQYILIAHSIVPHRICSILAHAGSMPVASAVQSVSYESLLLFDLLNREERTWKRSKCIYYTFIIFMYGNP